MSEEEEKISGTVIGDAWEDPDIDMTDPDVAKAVLEVSKNVAKRKNNRLWHRITHKFSENLPDALWKGFLFLAVVIGGIITAWSKT